MAAPPGATPRWSRAVKSPCPGVALPWSRTATGLRLAVRLTPRAAREGWGGIRDDGAGRAWLVARVTSPPVEGAANAALVRLVARTLRVPRSAVTFAAGETARSKTLEIAGDAAALEERLRALTG